MLPHIARACRRERLASEVSQSEVAAIAGVTRQTVGEFEAGRNWPRNPDRVVGAYAQACDGDAVQIWALAASSLDVERREATP